MKHLALASFVVILLINAAYVRAQDSILGSYSGGFATKDPSGNSSRIGVQLTISSIDGEVVKGTATLSTRGPCRGTFPMEGKYSDSKLAMRAAGKSDSGAGDCLFSFAAVKQGNKLVGTTGGPGNPIELSK